MIARWEGDEESGPLWLETLREIPGPDGERWRAAVRVTWNKSRTLFAVGTPGEGSVTLGEARSLPDAKREAVRISGATSVAPLGAPCPACSARRVKAAALINYECPNSRCPASAGEEKQHERQN